MNYCRNLCPRKILASRSAGRSKGCTLTREQPTTATYLPRNSSLTLLKPRFSAVLNCKRRVTKDRKLELVGKDHYELLELRAVIRWTGATATATGGHRRVCKETYPYGSAANTALSFPFPLHPPHDATGPIPRLPPLLQRSSTFTL